MTSVWQLKNMHKLAQKRLIHWIKNKMVNSKIRVTLKIATHNEKWLYLT